MKKIATILFAVMMMLSLLSACGGTAQQGGAASSPPAKSAPGASDSTVGSSTPEQTSGPKSNWPDHEVRLIIPYKEGGGSHKVALLTKSASEANKLMKQPFIVVCMPNAATLEGQEEVLYATPDGYTLLVHHNAMINNYALGKQDFTYGDFEMICQLYSTPLAIAVRASSPWQTLDDVVTAIKTSPGTYSWTWAGLGGNTHFASYVFYKAAGFSGDEVIPSITKGDSESVVSVVGGTTDIVIAQPNAFTEYVASGDLRVLGHSGAGDMDIGGEMVPSWSDQGYDGTYNLRCFLFAPKGTPEDVLYDIRAVMEQVVSSDEFQAGMIADGSIPEYLDHIDAIEAFRFEAESAESIASLMDTSG